MTAISRRALLAGAGGTLAGSALGLPMLLHSTPARAEEASLATRLADYAAGLGYADLDAATVEQAKIHLVDALGCALGAFRETPVKAVRGLAPAKAGTRAATVLGTTVRTTPDWASFINGAAVRFLDLNDTYAGREVGHPSDNITPCLAVAESEGRSGRDFLLAMVLAYEIDCHLLDTVQISARGWDHPNFSLPAAALAAGKLMRLDAARLAQAVNLSFAGHLASNQTRLEVISHWKGLADADAGRNGVFAAELARAGITGPAPAFEGKAGFFKMVSGPFELDVAGFGGHGHPFKINACQIKAYPAQALLQTAIVAAVRLGAKIPDPARIAAIAVTTSHAGMQYSADSPEKWAPKTSGTADHSLPYIVARTLLDHEITAHSYSEKAMADPRLKTLLGKLTVEEDAALTAMYPQKIPNRVTIKLDDGRELSEEVDDLPGFGGKPMARPDAEEKFRRNAKGVMAERQMHALLDAAWTLDRAPNLGTLFERARLKG